MFKCSSLPLVSLPLLLRHRFHLVWLRKGILGVQQMSVDHCYVPSIMHCPFKTGWPEKRQYFLGWVKGGLAERTEQNAINVCLLSISSQDHRRPSHSKAYTTEVVVGEEQTNKGTRVGWMVLLVLFRQTSGRPPPMLLLPIPIGFASIRSMYLFIYLWTVSPKC